MSTGVPQARRSSLHVRREPGAVASEICANNDTCESRLQSEPTEIKSEHERELTYDCRERLLRKGVSKV